MTSIKTQNSVRRNDDVRSEHVFFPGEQAQ